MKDNKNLGNVRKSALQKHRSPKLSSELPQAIPGLPHLSHKLYGFDGSKEQKVMIFDEFSTETLLEVDGSVTSRYEPIQNVKEELLGLRKFKKVQIEKENGNGHRKVSKAGGKKRQSSRKK